MFEFEGFGTRLQQLRKQKGVTQDELASRVNVTGQAVSKWENNQSYPDITLIPTLATILDTEIDYLFGKKTIQKTGIFPATHAGMPMVHSTQYVACYSDKVVSVVDQSGVKFVDGSTAELSSRLAVNVGQGEIQFLGEDNAPEEWHDIDSSVTTKNAEFGYTQNVDITVYSCDCQIIPSQDGKTRVTATGEALFIKMLKIESRGDILYINQKPINNYNSLGHKNTIIVEMPCESGNKAEIKINGSGRVASEIKFFHAGQLAISGSGEIKTKGFGTCRAAISGSGHIRGACADELSLVISGSGAMDWGVARSAKVTISGSGAVDLSAVAALSLGISGSGTLEIKEMSGGGDCIAKINGSGAVDVGSGNCNKFEVDVNGSCDIDAAGLSAREATIVLHHDGIVTLGRVLERSTEQIKKKGQIRIMQRG